MPVTQLSTRRKMVEPINVLQLMKTVGPTRAADKLGVSTTLLHKARKEGGVNQVIEIAATNVLEHLADALPPAPRPAPQPRAVRGKEVLFLVAVPADKVDTLQRIALAIGAELVSA